MPRMKADSATTLALALELVCRARHAEIVHEGEIDAPEYLSNTGQLVHLEGCGDLACLVDPCENPFLEDASRW